MVNGKNGIVYSSERSRGVIVLLAVIGIAVMVFVLKGTQIEKYSYLEEEVFLLDYGVSDIIEKKKHDFENIFRACTAVGTGLCIFGVIPLFFTKFFENAEFLEVCSVGILIAMVACGVYLFVWSGMINGSYQKLLQIKDYTADNKRMNKKISSVAGVYWCLVTTIYIGMSFYTMEWGRTWIIWPCAGVLFGAICGLMHVVLDKK